MESIKFLKLSTLSPDVKGLMVYTLGVGTWGAPCVNKSLPPSRFGRSR